MLIGERQETDLPTHVLAVVVISWPIRDLLFYFSYYFIYQFLKVNSLSFLKYQIK